MERNYLVVFLVGTMRECPFGDYDPACLTNELKKKLSTKQFFKYITSLTDAELNTLYEQHLTCQNRTSYFGNLNINNSIV